MKSRVRSIAIAVGFALIGFACSDSSTAPTTVSSVAVTGSAPTVGGTSQFTAKATLSNGTTQDVTSQAMWQVADTTIATVSAAGVVSGIAAGSTTVTATYQGITGSDVIAIVAP